MAAWPDAPGTHPMSLTMNPRTALLTRQSSPHSGHPAALDEVTQRIAHRIRAVVVAVNQPPPYLPRHPIHPIRVHAKLLRPIRAPGPVDVDGGGTRQVFD